ncbi:MAG: hypothetical protein M1816_005756 [Peltula sp. TS41687]|nr:MAG: hypothetical protein M1816_005756 [Peltula sp. TS41687]
MSFRKRNVPLTRTTNITSPSCHAPQASSAPPTTSSLPTPTHPPGTRPSYLDSRLLTTSTGTSSLDDLLAGHGGLALGTSVLVEENGTTDYAGTLLKYFAAEGVVQGHVVYVVGVGEEWARGLPGLVIGDEKGKRKDVVVDGGREKEKMKIAWRYEGLGEFGAEPGSRVSSPAPERYKTSTTTAQFCHTFDLTKRLTIPSPSPIKFIPIPAPTNTTSSPTSPFTPIIETLRKSLTTSPPTTLHRLIIPTLLSPLTYPPQSSQPQHILQFLHSLRGLLRQHANQLTAMISLPLDLYARSTSLVRWMELLSDGVLELTPFPHSIIQAPTIGATTTTQEEPPQGILHLHRLPVFHERGGDGGKTGGLGEDLAFTLTRRRFVVRPFSLPPVDGGGGGEGEDVNAKQSRLTTRAADLEF